MVLSLVGWINGLSHVGVVITGCVLGLFYIYKSKKSDAKLLFYMGVTTFFAGLVLLGGLVDFISILLTGKNIDNSYGLVGILDYMWGPLLFIFAMYMGAELLIPEKKWYIVLIYSILGVIFELCIFLDPLGSFKFVYPETPGEDIIDQDLAFGSLAFIIYFFFFLSLIIFWGFGFLIKSIKSSGIIRKKFLILSIGTFIIVAFTMILVFSSLFGIISVFARIGFVCSYGIFYFGLREESEKTKKIHTKKEIKIEGDLFRISQFKKEDITEEEVSISKEKKICLVCKGDVSGINYICTECGAFYCMNCSQAIIDLENSCWACNSPIDESKPVKLFKREAEEIDIEISNKK